MFLPVPYSHSDLVALNGDDRDELKHQVKCHWLDADVSIRSDYDKKWSAHKGGQHSVVLYF